RHDYVTCPAKRIKTKTRNPKGVSSWFRVPSPPLFACNVVATRGARVDLPRPRDFLLRIDEHFLPLGDPSGRARNGEEHGEELDREAHRLVNQSRVEVDVRIELAGDEVLVLEGDALQFQRDFEERILASHGEDHVRDSLDDLRARVVRLVDA